MSENAIDIEENGLRQKVRIKIVFEWSHGVHGGKVGWVQDLFWQIIPREPNATKGPGTREPPASKLPGHQIPVDSEKNMKKYNCWRCKKGKAFEKSGWISARPILANYPGEPHHQEHQQHTIRDKITETTQKDRNNVDYVLHLTIGSFWCGKDGDGWKNDHLVITHGVCLS